MMTRINRFEQTTEYAGPGRWWATDSAVVEALEKKTPEALQFAAHRLGIILESYTVYLDLWIADASGQVVANGQPNRFPAALGSDVTQEQWFRSGLTTRDGTEFAVADITLQAHSVCFVMRCIERCVDK